MLLARINTKYFIYCMKNNETKIYQRLLKQKNLILIEVDSYDRLHPKECLRGGSFAPSVQAHLAGVN